LVGRSSPEKLGGEELDREGAHVRERGRREVSEIKRKKREGR
jgi:hypothetical protein